jgi:hypothetical protein
MTRGWVYDAPVFKFTVNKLTRGGRFARNICAGERAVDDHEYGLVKPGAVEATFKPLYEKYTNRFGRIELVVFTEGVPDEVVTSVAAGEWSSSHHVAAHFRYIPAKERRANARAWV